MPEFREHGWLRAGIGLLIIAAALWLIDAVIHLEFGIGWVALVPALAAVWIAAGLLRRRTVIAEAGRLRIVDGWLWRRDLGLGVDGARLVLLPTMGLTAVVLERNGAQRALGAWLTAAAAQRLAAVVDAAAGTPLPRHAPAARDRLEGGL